MNNRQIAQAVLKEADANAATVSPGSRILNLPTDSVERILSLLDIEADAEVIAVSVRKLVSARRRLEGRG